jgi:hypothetical protein
VLEFVATAIGEAVVYLVGLLIGKTLNIKNKDAYRVGEMVLLFVLLSLITIITLLYS